MIGVAVRSAERPAAAEFFELCKTPWEFFRDESVYDVMICSGEPPGQMKPAKLLVLLPEVTMVSDQEAVSGSGASRPVAMLEFNAEQIPIYKTLATFPASKVNLMRETSSHEAAIQTRQLSGGGLTVTMGYNLFAEAEHLLAKGQPPAQAASPTLELHIKVLREIITRAGIPFVEIPPIPAGHPFTACLTHDIDHPILRNHFCDHTMFGFLHRATLGSLLDWFRGRKTLARIIRNAGAAFRLPFVFVGLARDFWASFDHYIALEKGRPSTYFFITRGGYAGLKVNGAAPALRASRYSLTELAPQLQRIVSTGNEVGLHGIDAWRDPESGRQEQAALTDAVGPTSAGVRMHWLYFNQDAPAALDAAGFAYDSSIGYNNTVGYKAGTTQAYRPLGTKNLMELPLHVMDTALFYPDYMDLQESEARSLVASMADNAERLGGVLTINWHDRSIAPERLWGDFYVTLLDNLERRGAWFATAAQTVDWFKKRRTALIECAEMQAGAVQVRISNVSADALPQLTVRVHKPRNRSADPALEAEMPARHVDLPLERDLETTIAL